MWRRGREDGGCRRRPWPPRKERGTRKKKKRKGKSTSKEHAVNFTVDVSSMVHRLSVLNSLVCQGIASSMKEAKIENERIELEEPRLFNLDEAPDVLPSKFVLPRKMAKVRILFVFFRTISDMILA